MKGSIVTDFSNSVLVPRDHFTELETAAYDNSHVPTAGERVASTLQTGGVLGLMAAAVVAGTWGWAAGVDWLEKRRQRRFIAKHDVTKKSDSQD